MKSLSPLRYPGSKRKIVRYLDRILNANKLEPKILVEPFVGGGSVFLHFLSQDNSRRAIIGDKDELVYAFWKTALRDPKKLFKFISNVQVNLKTFDYYRKVANSPKKFPVSTLAEACIFLNRTSFSGILNRSAGPIGGRKQESEYRIDCRFNKKELIKQISSVSLLGDRVTVLPYDWRKTIQFAQKKKISNEKVLFYFDPPFFRKANQLYRHYFDYSLHKKLRDKLVSMKKNKWILSYDKAEEIKKLYSVYKPIHVQMAYSVNSPAKRLEKEYVITPLKLPRFKKVVNN